MQVLELWRYPAKSMLGQRCDSAEIGPLGMLLDRHWAVWDEARGGIVGAKKIGGLMMMSARFVEREVSPGIRHIEITLPDGTTVCSDDPRANDLVSEALGRRVRLSPLEDDPDHYLRAAPDSTDVVAEGRKILGLEDDEPFPDMSVFPADVGRYESPPGTYYDVYPLVISSTGSLDTLRSLLPDTAMDWRRFRPSIVVDLPATEVAPWPEMELLGQRLRIGDEVEVQIQSGGVPRCVMATRQVAELPEDRRIMRTLVRETGQCFGIYATIAATGTIRVGDEITVR